MTTPSYNPQIPQADNTIADSQKAFLTNFSTLFSAFNSNHVSLIHPTDPGNHSTIELVEQSLPRITTSEEIAFYTKKVAGQTTQLFMRYPTNGKEFQVSNFQIFDILPSNGQFPFFSFLPGGIIAYFGVVDSAGLTSFTINLNPAICTNIMGVNLGCINAFEPQPNVSLVAPPSGFYEKVILSSSNPMTSNAYLIFGNT